MVQVTEAEWKIMECLWDHAPQAMSEITKTLEPGTGWTRHTVITLLKRLAEKGAVSVENNGYVHLYTPLISKEESSAFETRKLVSRAFGGQPAMLVNNLVDSGDMTVDELQSLLDAIRDKK
ncbi:MAG: BlaI/MecI/CopY family transcriptional regulator [Clostridia bacterium]|nr:BlaI/MecI/CopY family transcriptional regulator [Clostridia bacterium]